MLDQKWSKMKASLVVEGKKDKQNNVTSSEVKTKLARESNALCDPMHWILCIESRPYIGQKLCPVVALCGPGFDFAHVQLEELASVSSYSSTLPLVSFHCFVKIFKVALVFSCPKLWDIRHPLAFATIPEDVATLQHLSEGLRNDCEILLHAAALSEQDFGGQDWRLSWSRDGGELKIWNNI